MFLLYWGQIYIIDAFSIFIAYFRNSKLFDIYSLQFNCTAVCPPDKNHHVESNDINDEGLIVCANSNHPMVQARMMADKEYVTQYIF